MRTPHSILAMTALISTAGIGILSPVANAQEVQNIESDNVSTSTQFTPDNHLKVENNKDTINIETVDSQTAVQTSGVNSLVEKDKAPKAEKSKTKETDFIAHVYIYTPSGLKTGVIKDEGNKLSEELSKLNIDLGAVKLATGETADPEGNLKDGDSIVLFSDYTESTVEEVSMSAPVQIIEDENILIGEEEIVSEGKDGIAIQTIVNKSNLSLDAQKNTKSEIAYAKGDLLTGSESILTILESPEAKIIKKGIKELPVIQETVNQVITQNPSLGSSSSSASTPLVGNAGEGTIGKNYSKEAQQLSESTKNAAVSIALQQVGKAYVWGATGPSSFDCSGLIQWVYNTNLGKSVPRLAEDQGRYGTPVSWSEIQPGDVIWNSGHIGMYIGDGKMVHASNPERGVVIDGIGWAQSSGFQVARY